MGVLSFSWCADDVKEMVGCDWDVCCYRVMTDGDGLWVFHF